MTKNLEHSKAKQEWLAKKLKNFKNKQSSFEIAPQSRPENLPLSFSQIRLWFLEQWESGSSAYLLSYAWRLQGTLDRKVLSSSLDHLVARHETLRTKFATREGHPVQIIEPALPLVVPLIDLSEQNESSKEAECERLIHEEAKKGFDIQTGPLVRAKLIRLGNEEHVFLLTFHHIITDGWSMGIFFKEFSSLYTAQISGHPPQLLPLPIQFVDFAIWQRHWLQGEELNRQVKYWQTQLNNAPHQLELPTDSPRPPQQTYQGQSISFTLPSALGQAINALCRIHGVTIFMTLMTAFQVLLFRYSGQRDILIGTPIAGRSHSELENLIGFFVNTLVLRMQFKENPTFEQVLFQVRDTCLEAYAHQDLPFEKLVDILQCARDPSRHPLFQVLFQLHHRNQSEGLTLQDLTVTNITRTTHTAKFDLSLAMTSDLDILQGTFNFNTDLFEYPTIKRLANNFQVLLEGLVRNPTHPISQMPFLTSVERHQLLCKGNATSTFSLEANTVHELFADQVALTPDAIAIVFDDQQLTYRELNERANRLAHVLQSKGVGLEVRIGICLERGLDLIISLLGVLKSGGAYVPLDPSAPLDRLCFMIEDAETAIVITSEAQRAQLESCQYQIKNTDFRRGFLMTLDMAWEYGTPENRSLHLPIVHTENLAYVMYTSGSTGKPKGVEITHRSIVRLVSTPTYFQWPRDAVFLQLASPAFDAATFEIWTCLVNGGKLVLGPPQLPSFDDFGDLLQKFQITVLWLTAGLFHQMVDWNVQALRSIQCLLAGGDVLSPRHVQRVVNQLPTCQLINGYGPTENTTFTCCFPIPQGNDFIDSIPIGKPIDQTQVYVLDTQQQLLPIGAPGELCIGGFGLARGYHHQPDWTAELFIPHPFSPSPGGRLYRSGDVFRYRNEHHLIFLGRQDRQVKVRGYRVECGEIEAALTGHSAVQDTIVLPCEDSLKNTRLVAYMVANKDPAPSISDLRFFLSQTLPSYMIPTEYVFLDTFPLTPNGKVDRQKLLAGNHSSSNDEETFIAPRNSIEIHLTKIWETVLGRHPIGVTDNFFHLGGESLMAVRLCSEIERTLQRKIPVTLIFHAQTIEQLALFLRQEGKVSPSSLMLKIQDGGANPPIFCVCFGATFGPYLKHYTEQPLYMFFNQGYDGRPALKTTVKEIATMYLNDLRTIQPRGPYYLAGYSFGGIVAYEMAQQLRAQEETIEVLILIDPSIPASIRKTASQHLQVATSLPAAKLRKNQEATPETHLTPISFNKILSGIQWRLRSLANTFKFLFKKITCIMIFKLGYSLPKPFRRFYTTMVVQTAAKLYDPEAYPGKIILFQTSKRMKECWENMALGGLETHNIPAQHLDIFNEPHIETVLHRFMNCLEATRNKDT
ncbi:MAG: amino acid adenylation domain-containing protein [Nitrospirales bacterium]